MSELKCKECSKDLTIRDLMFNRQGAWNMSDNENVADISFICPHCQGFGYFSIKILGII